MGCVFWGIFVLGRVRNERPRGGRGMSETVRFSAQLAPLHLIFSFCLLPLILLYLESFGRLSCKFIHRVLTPWIFSRRSFPLTKNSFVFLLIHRLPSLLSPANYFRLPPNLSIPIQLFFLLCLFFRLLLFFAVLTTVSIYYETVSLGIPPKTR